jgi:hypothetical protein
MITDQRLTDAEKTLNRQMGPILQSSISAEKTFRINFHSGAKPTTFEFTATTAAL